MYYLDKEDREEYLRCIFNFDWNKFDWAKLSDDDLINVAGLIQKSKIPAYDEKYGDSKLCKCGHPYYRHFDTYDGMSPVGCKYCGNYKCQRFIPASVEYGWPSTVKEGDRIEDLMGDIKGENI